MKLTKQRLKEIIKEEVTSIRESDGDDWGYMPPREPGSWPRPRDMQTQPRFDTDPEEEAEQRVEAIENELEHLLGKMDIDEKEELVAYITKHYLRF